MATRYATQQDIIDEFGEAQVKHWFGLTEDADFTATQDAFIDRMINVAEELIDAHLSAQTTTPITGDALTAASVLLKMWTVRIACYYIYDREGLKRVGAGNTLEGGYEKILALLDKYRIGELRLPGAAGGASQVSYGHVGTESTTSSDYLSLAFQHDTLEL